MNLKKLCNKYYSMNIKNGLIGVFVTLSVTVVAGVVVYYFTKEPVSTKPAESLIYTLEKPQKFTGEERKLSFANLRVANLGDMVANNVIVAIKLDTNLKIVDKNITLSSGPAGMFTSTMIKPSEFQVKIPTLTPNETASISLLIDGDASAEFNIGIKSDKSVGTKGSIVKTVIEGESLRGLAVSITILFSLALLSLLLFIIYTYLKLRRHYFPSSQSLNDTSSQSLNDTAFLYLHKDLVTEAATMLEHEIQNSGADAHILANYGLALALEGDLNAAKKQFDAAEFFSEESHEKAVVLFNRSIAEFKSNDKELGLQYLKEAHDLSPSKIDKYAKYSNLISEIALSVPEINEVLNIDK
jgi:hypothetical protein